MNLSLTVKFNLAFLAVFAAGFAATGYVADMVLQENAVQTTVRDASLIIEAATAAQNYTSEQVTPLLATQINTLSSRSRFPRIPPSRACSRSRRSFRASRTRARCSIRPILATAPRTGRPM